MKFLAVFFCGLIAAGVAYPAGADTFGRETGFRPFIQGQTQGQAQGPARRRGAKQPMPQRGARGTEEIDRGDRGHMSPEERRQLRRDIRDAGRDIYRPGRNAPAGRRRSDRR